MLSPAYAEVKRLRSSGDCGAAVTLLQAGRPATDDDAFEAVICLFVCGDMQSSLQVVRTYPWQNDSEISYQVTLDIRQLHSETDGYAVIEAGWRAYSLPDRRLKASKTFTAREPLESAGYNASVAAQSRLLERLAENIAASLR